MQVIIFDKTYHCLYRLQKVPKNWKFDRIFCELELKGDPSDYQYFYMKESLDLCIDEFIYEDGELKLTGSTCD